MARNKDEEGQEEEMNRHAVVTGMAALVSAIMSPLFIRFRFGDYGELQLVLDGMFYRFDCNVFFKYRLMFCESWDLFGQFLLWSFRLVFVYQLVRFYKGKTTTGLLVLAGMLGETPTILHITYTMLMGFVVLDTAPLPLHLLVAWVFLKARPPPEISTPWVEVSDASDS